MLAWACTLAVSCGGLGPSCGGCGPTNYTYPSKVMQGTEVVDDGFRARLTERGLDFIAANFKEILRSQFPPDPSNPNVSRIRLPSQVFLDQQSSDIVDGKICLKGTATAGAQPAGCVPSSGTYDGNKVSSLLIDLNELENKIQMDFITSPAPGVRLTVNDLLLGLDGRIWTEVKFFDIDQFRTDADCDLHGETSLTGGPFPYGTVGSIDLVAEIMPRVSTNPLECQNGAAQCFMADINVTSAAIEGVGLGVDAPPKCTGTNTPAGCSRACSDLFAGGVLCSGVTTCNSDILCPDPLANCECTDLFCPTYNFGAEIISQIADFLFTIIQPFLDNILTLALDNLLDQFNGMPLEFKGQLDIASFAGNAVPGLEQANPLGFVVAPTNNAFNVTCPTGTASCNVRRGMDFYLKSGMEAVHDPAAKKPSPAECVPAIQGAKFLQLYAATAFESADGSPLTGEFLDTSTNMPVVYDLAASLSRAAINQMGYAIFNGGVMCLSLDSWAVHGLTGGGFSLTAGALDLLTGGRLSQFVDPKAPVLLTMAPEEPPVFTMGAGTETDPHLSVSMKKLHLAIYVMMYERWARLFEVSTDVSAGLNILPNEMTHELTITVANGPNIENFQQLYNELIPDVDFGNLLPSLLNVALGALLNQDISFNFDVAPIISDALGGAPIYVVFEALQTERVANTGEFLNLYLSLSNVDPNPAPQVARVDIQVAREPGTAWRDESGRPRATGIARMEGVTGPLPPDHRYGWRVDFGPWHDFVAPDENGVLWVEDARLALAGEHEVDIRSMLAGRPSTVSDTVRRVKVWTDPYEPEVELRRVGTDVVVNAQDRHADTPRLRMRWRADDGEFSAWDALHVVPTADAEFITVEVRDPAGNVAMRTLDLVDRAATRAAESAEAPATSAQSCTCSSAGSRGPWLAMMLGLLAVFVRRRR